MNANNKQTRGIQEGANTELYNGTLGYCLTIHI